MAGLRVDTAIRYRSSGTVRCEEPARRRHSKIETTEDGHARREQRKEWTGAMGGPRRVSRVDGQPESRRASADARAPEHRHHGQPGRYKRPQRQGSASHGTGRRPPSGGGLQQGRRPIPRQRRGPPLQGTCPCPAGGTLSGSFGLRHRHPPRPG